MWCLEGIDLFKCLDPESLKELGRLVKEGSYRRKETIYMPGDRRDALYIVKAGKVKLSYLGSNGKRLTLSILKKGRVFGVTALVDERRHTFLAEALTDVVLCALSRTDFTRFLVAHPRWSLSVAKVIGRHMKELEQKLTDLVFKGLNVRLATLLLRLFHEFKTPCSSCPLHKDWERISLKLTHADLAHLVGASRESTTLEINRFERSGAIRFCNLGLERGCKRSIIVLDEEKLEQVAQNAC